MKRFLLWVIAIVISIVPNLVQAETNYSSIDLNYIGLGARALAMGNSHIAAVDDESSILWNPAGCARLSKLSHISIGASYFSKNSITTQKADLLNNADDSYGAFDYLLSGWNFNNYRMPNYLSIGYYRMVDFYKDINIDSLSYEANIRGGIDVFAIALAYKIKPWLSMGLAFNHYFGKFKFNDIDSYDYSDSYHGNNLTLGIQAQYSDVFWGIVLRTPFDMRVNQPDSLIYLKMPLNIGMGLTYQISRNFLISGDFETRFFSTSSAKDKKGETIFVFDSSANENVEWINWKNAYLLSSGIEYLTQYRKYEIPLRFGVSNRKLAIVDAVQNRRNEWGITGGFGLASENIKIDIAVRYALQNWKEMDQNENSLLTLSYRQVQLLSTITIVWPN